MFGIVTKTDLAAPEQIAARLTELTELMEFAEVLPCSAVDGFQVDLLADLLVARLPEGPPLYPDGELTDEPEETLVAELIREAALEGVRDELPHSIAVVIEEMVPREGRDDLLDVHANLYVERSSQKGIVIGKGGERLRQVGTDARRQIEALLGTKIYLDLHVKMAKDWQRDPKQLRKLGLLARRECCAVLRTRRSTHDRRGRAAGAARSSRRAPRSWCPPGGRRAAGPRSRRRPGCPGPASRSRSGPR